MVDGRGGGAVGVVVVVVVVGLAGKPDQATRLLVVKAEVIPRFLDRPITHHPPAGPISADTLDHHHHHPPTRSQPRFS